MSDKLEQLKDAARKANAALSKEEHRIHDETNRAVVGKFFKYRNSYSCPQKPSDYFWLYLKVISASGGRLKTFTFQTDNRGRIDIETHCNLYHISDGYREISATEYRKAWKTMEQRIAKARP